MLGAFDLETDGLGGKILSVAWRSEGDSNCHISHDVADFLEVLVKPTRKKIIWYGHNAGEFDLKHLLPYLLKLGLPIDKRSQGKLGRCIGFVMKHGKQRIELRDSFALCPTSLKAMGEAYSPELPKMTGAIDFEHGETFDWNNPTHVDYAKRDVDALLVAVTRLWQTSLEVFGCWPAWTAGGTAMKAWRQTLSDEECYWPSHPSVEAYSRAAYKGAYSPIYKRGTFGPVEAADANSMYPSVMRGHDYPTGRAWKVTEFETERLGLYRIIAKVPDDVSFTVLSKRTPDGVIWALGEFEDFATTPEILYARERGYQITVIDGYVWEERVRPFDKFVDICEAFRMRHTGDAIATQVKLTANALYGKFGARRESEDTLISTDEDAALAAGYIPQIDPKTGNFVPNCYTKSRTMNEPYMLPHWAAYITAYARLKLMHAIEGIGPEKVLYGDTDSIWVEGRIDPATLELHPAKFGAWKIERHELLHLDAPKSYATEDDRGSGRDMSIHSKGIPARFRHSDDVAAALRWHLKPEVSWEGLMSMRASLAAGGTSGPVSRRFKRHYSAITQSKGWVVASDGVTVRPRRLELAA